MCVSKLSKKKNINHDKSHEKTKIKKQKNKKKPKTKIKESKCFRQTEYRKIPRSVPPK